MRLIDADALKEGIKELKQSPWYNNDINPSWRQGIKDAVHVVETLCIDEEPTVDAVPVVRCKDCEYGRPYLVQQYADNKIEFMTYLWCGDMCYATNGNGFCSKAERREDDRPD